MEDLNDRATPLDRSLLWAAVLLATVYLAWIQFSFGGLYDLDSYFHVRAAEQLWQHGVEKTFPQAAFSTWADTYSDKDFLFHLLLAPFVTAGDFMTGGKWAVVLLDFLVLASFALALSALRVRAGWLWVLLLVSASPYYVTRLSSVRPHILGLAFVAVEIALLLKRRAGLLFVVSALHVLSHSSFPLVILLLLAWAAALALARETLPVREMAAVVSGVVVATFAHPFFPNNLGIFDQQIGDVLLRSASELTGIDWGGGASIPREAVGSELHPLTWQTFLALWPGWTPALVALAVTAAARRGTLGAEYAKLPWTPAHTFITLVTVAFLGLALLSRRFVDVFVLAALLFAAALLTRVAGVRPLGDWWRARPVIAGGATAVLAACLVIGAVRVAGLRETFARQAFGDSFLPAVQAVARVAQPGDVVFHPSWQDFSVLYAFRPEGRYISGLDPIFLYRRDPELFRLNLDMTSGRTHNVARAVAQSFGARWVFLSTQPRDRIFRNRLARVPGVQRLYADPFAEVWMVPPAPPAGVPAIAPPAAQPPAAQAPAAR